MKRILNQVFRTGGITHMQHGVTKEQVSILIDPAFRIREFLLQTAFLSDRKVILRLAGNLPLGLAMEKTGAARMMVDMTLHWARHSSPKMK